MKYGITILVSVVCVVPAAAQDPRAVLPIWVDYVSVPEQIDELTGMADAIAVVRVDSIRFESVWIQEQDAHTT